MRCLRVTVATYCEGYDDCERGWTDQDFHIVGATMNTPLEIIRKAILVHIRQTEISKYRIEGKREIDLQRDMSPFGAYQIVLDLNGHDVPREGERDVELDEALALAESL